MKTYVAGFMFRKNDQEVALVLKNKPAFQVGKLNAIGGKIEEGENPIAAMTREFFEETGCATEACDWRNYAVLGGKDWKVYFYVCRSGSGRFLKTMEEEQIAWYPVPDLNRRNIAGDKDRETIHNLRWLIPLALDKDEVIASILDNSTF